MDKKYICCFPGKRDNYQLPLALYETGRLASFITGIYNKGFLANLLKQTGYQSKIINREIDKLPSNLVKAHPFFEYVLTIFDKLKIERAKSTVWQDYAFSHFASQFATKYKVNLLLYEFQAAHAFKMKYKHNIKKVLFHFHPHPDFDHSFLAQDIKNYPDFKQEFLSSTRGQYSNFYKNHTKKAYLYADHVIVASSFTKKSLIYAGCEENKITVVPYGIEKTNEVQQKAVEIPNNKPFFLFVGSGSHRKGLHHLLEAWLNVSLNKEYYLVVVSRVIAEPLKKYLSHSSILFFNGVDKFQLNWLYANTTCFVLPSLSEGFGQVYLEALANGARIIGTTHSCLPDLLEFQDFIQYVDPADVHAIIKELEKSAKNSPDNKRLQKLRNTDVPKLYSWQRFRDGINDVLNNLE